MKFSKLIIILSIILYPQFLLASGNVLPRPTSDALGMADANVALVSGPSAQFINPANMADADKHKTRWEAGSLLGKVTTSFSRSTAASAAASGNFNTKTGYPLVPFFAITQRYSDRTTIGFAVNSPHGLGVEWKDHTWDLNLGALGTADLVKKAELKVLRFGPAASLKINNAWNAGIRLFAQYIDARDESDISTVEADGFTVGTQIGVRYRAPDFIFGAAYTSRTNTEVKGTLSGIHPVAAASLIAGDAKADILLPDRLQTGMAFKIHPKIWWEVDLDWIGWSYVDELSIIQSNGSLVNAGKNQRGNKNTLSVRTGFKWQKGPRITLYAGLGYDPTPVPEQDASPITSMLRKTRLGLGMSRLLANDMKLDVAYQFIRGHSRRINETVQDTFGGADTNLYEGTYESKTHVLGISLTGNF